MEESPFLGGYINAYKPIGWTSTDVVRKIKRLTGVKKVGHGGTLDPLASGVLPIFIGSATRFSDVTLTGRKVYLITVELGTATDTYDAQGKLTFTGQWHNVTESSVRELLSSFVGTFKQKPPMHSAVKKNGKRLYKIARSGNSVDIQPRDVSIYNAQVVNWNPPEFEIELSSSSGFYARSLAHTMGLKLKSAAHMSKLIRKESGAFKLSSTYTIPQIEQMSSDGKWQEALLDIDYLFMHLPKIILNDYQSYNLKRGSTIRSVALKGAQNIHKLEQARAYTSTDKFIGLLEYKPEQRVWQVIKVVPKFYQSRS